MNENIGCFPFTESSHLALAGAAAKIVERQYQAFSGLLANNPFDLRADRGDVTKVGTIETP
jgi:hypothetical protein